MDEIIEIEDDDDVTLVPKHIQADNQELVLSNLLNILKILFLTDVSRAEVKVTVHKRAKLNGSLFHYEVHFDITSCICPCLSSIIQSNPNRSTIKESYQYQCNTSGCHAFQVSRLETNGGYIVEVLDCTSEIQYSIQTKTFLEKQSPSIIHRFILSEISCMEIAHSLKKYLHHLYNLFRKSWKIIFCNVNEETISSTTFMLPNEQSAIIGKQSVLTSTEHYSRNKVDSNLTFKTSGPILIAEKICNDKPLKMTLGVSVNQTSNSAGSLSALLYGPYNLPVFRNATATEALADALNCIAWEDYNVHIGKPLPGVNQAVLEALVKRELLSENQNQIEITIIAIFDVVSKKGTQTEKILDVQYFHMNFETVLSKIKPMFLQCLQKCLDQSWLCGKTLKRKRKETAAASNTAHSLFEIVCHSCNDRFRDTCMSMMSSNNSHEFKQNIKQSLDRIAEGKHKKVKIQNCSAQSEDSMWKILEDSI